MHILTGTAYPHGYCIQFIQGETGQFLFCSHVQVLVSAVHKPKQTWSVESFSTFARLKECSSTQQHAFLDESIVT